MKNQNSAQVFLLSSVIEITKVILKIPQKKKTCLYVPRKRKAAEIKIRKPRNKTFGVKMK